MSKSARRLFAFLVVASPLLTLAACSSDTTAPATSTVKASASMLCETQGSNSRC